MLTKNVEKWLKDRLGQKRFEKKRLKQKQSKKNFQLSVLYKMLHVVLIPMNFEQNLPIFAFVYAHLTRIIPTIDELAHIDSRSS